MGMQRRNVRARQFLATSCPSFHESTPLLKLPSLITVAVTAALLAACSGSPAAEPDARATTTPAATSKPASPPVAPPEVEAEEAEPEKVVEPDNESSAEPPAVPAAEASEEPVPNLEPLPAGPEDPFVPLPHGEPNPLAPAAPGAPEGATSHFENPTVYPVPAGTYTPAVVVRQGATLTVAGDGYAPGEEINVALAWPATDYSYIDQPAVYAGPDGSYRFPISIGASMPPRDYVVMTWTPRVGDHVAREGSKRYHNVQIIPG